MARFGISSRVRKFSIASEGFSLFAIAATLIGIVIQHSLPCHAAFVVGGGGLLKQSYANHIQYTLGEGELTFNNIFTRHLRSSAAELAANAVGVSNTVTVIEIEELTLYHQHSDFLAFHMPRQVIAWRNTGSLVLPNGGTFMTKSRFDSTFFNLSTGFSAQESPSEPDKNIEFTLGLDSKGGAYALPNFSVLHLENQYQWTVEEATETVIPWYTRLSSGFAPLNDEYSGYPSVLAYAYASGDQHLQSFFHGNVSIAPFSSADEQWNTKVIINSFEVYALSTTPIIPEPASGLCFLTGLALYLGAFRRQRQQQASPRC